MRRGSGLPATAGLIFWLLIPLSAAVANEFITLTYHDVVDYSYEVTSDAVTVDRLVDHFEWLRVNKYHPISIDDIEAARTGTRPLPDKAILLTWDDGYVSFYTHVFPLLKVYNYPAVIALVGSWMEGSDGDFVQYSGRLVPRNKFMSWEQLQEIQTSRLVEIASHSYDLHKGVVADRYGDISPAAISHKFDRTEDRYETEQQFRQRIRNDLQGSSDQIFRHFGFRPRVMVWPYGYYNNVALDIARELGMHITLTLASLRSELDRLDRAGRYYVTGNADIKAFRDYLEPSNRLDIKHFFRVNSYDLLEPSPSPFVQGWLKLIADKYKLVNPSIEEEQQFDLFIKRVKDLRPGMVILDPVVTIGERVNALFTNSRFPVAQDRLNRLCWHTKKNVGVPVSLWLSPELFSLQDGETSETVNRFFIDMGKSAPNVGLIVDSPDLIKALLKTAQNESGHQSKIRFWNPDKRRSARQELLQQTDDLQITQVLQPLELFQQWRPFLEVSPVLSIQQFLDMELHQFEVMLSLFDFLIVTIKDNSIKALRDRLEPQLRLLNEADCLRQCAFLLSAEERGDLIARELQQLPELNIIHWGYQFDNFLEGVPTPAVIRPLISDRSFPYPLRD